MHVRSALKSAIRLMACRATDVAFGWRHKKRWLDKQGLGAMHETYFDDHLSRLPVANAVATVISKATISNPSIIEFGCSGGNNLKLLRERLPVPIRYCGLDIQESAIAFARSQFPEETFHVCPWRSICDGARSGAFDIFLVSGVLYYLPQKEAQSVFRFAAEIADHVVVCDILECFDKPIGQNDGLSLHPFQPSLPTSGPGDHGPTNAP